MYIMAGMDRYLDLERQTYIYSNRYIYVITFNKDMYKAHLLFPDFIPALNFPDLFPLALRLHFRSCYRR